MALLMMEGFEQFVNIAALQRKFTTNGSSNISLENGRFGGKCLRLTDNYIEQAVIEASKTYILGFAFRSGGSVTTVASAAWSLSLVGTDLRLLIPNASVDVSIGTLVHNRWYYFEVKWTHSTSANLIVRRDTEELYNQSTLNISSVGSNLRFGGGDVDDIYLLDSTGSSLNDFLGLRVVEYLIPDAAGDSTQFTPSSGTNHAAVVVEDSDYVASSTGGHKDLYNIGSLQTIVAVNAIEQIFVAKKSDTTNRNFKPLIKNSSVETEGAQVDVTSESYSHFSNFFIDTFDIPSLQIGQKFFDSPVEATGGTVTEVGDYKIHTFTSGGTFTVTNGGEVEYLIVGGGGGGGGQNDYENRPGGGGGGGGVLTGSYTVAPDDYSITIGTGGARGTGTGVNGVNGGDSTAFALTAIGGGGGGHGQPTSGGAGSSGGSGGGGGTDGENLGGAGTSGQGNDGAAAVGSTNAVRRGGGGGSAGAAATDRNGADGLASSISGSSTLYAGGGGGGSHTYSAVDGSGGLGGGGRGASNTPVVTSTAGSPNTGGGGGAGSGHNFRKSSAGGSGIVIIRYPI